MTQEMAEPQSTEKREQSLLNIVCFVGAGLFLASVAYNLFAAGTIISTDGLFFTVVPLLLGLLFLVVPGLDIWKKHEAAKAMAAEGGDAAAGGAHTHAEPEEESHFAGSNRLFFSIWLWLLIL